MKKKSGFYIKLLSLIIILSTLPIIILGVFSYLKSSEIIQENISKEKQQSVYQIQANFEQVLKMVDLSATDFVTSPNLLQTLDEPLTEYQFQLFKETKNNMVQLQRLDAGARDFMLASLNEGWRINNQGIQRLTDEETETIRSNYLSSISNSSWKIERKNDVLFNSTADSTCEAYISLVKQLPLTAIEKEGVAIAYIPVCSFRDILTQNLESETIAVLDENYTVVGHSDFDNIGTDFSNEPFVTKLDKMTEDVGQYDITRDDGDYTVTYRKSSYNGWTYMSIIEMSELNKQSKSIGWFTLIIGSIILIGVLVLSYFGSKKLYKPINNLTQSLSHTFSNLFENQESTDEFIMIEKQIQHMLETNDQLESKLKGQLVQLRQFFMARLLQGKVNATELPTKYKSFNFNQNWKLYSIITIRIDAFDESRYREDEEDLLLFTINTMVEELISAEQRLTPIVVNKTQATIFLSNHENEQAYKEEITEIIELIQTKVKETLKISVSVGLSEVYTDLIQANLAFNESLEALRYTLKFGSGSIIFFENLQRESSFYTFFPKQLENDLFDAIKLGDKEAVDHHLDTFVETVFNEKLTQTQYEISIVRLLTNLLELTETLGIEVLEFEQHKSLFDQLYDFRTVPEVIDWFKGKIIYPIMNKVEKRTNSEYKNISDEIIHIVQQEFDSDLSLNYIADKLHYNPNYLSSIFRKETNTSFSDYLSLFRLEKAKEWLIETDMTVKEIAEKLNYNNSQNFIRSFRKVEGTTPGRYRKDKKSE